MGVFRGIPVCPEGVSGYSVGVPGCSGLFLVLQTPQDYINESIA